jgi:arylsulfatase A-like enzyme
MTKKPNILLITSDQHRGDCFGFEGRNVKTPHLDRMAKEGSRFSNCITPNAVCQPSRSSILTGLLPCTHGVSDNGIDLEVAQGEKGFGRTLASSGYQSGFVGKTHFSTHHTFAPTGTPEDKSTIPNLPVDWMGPYMGFDHMETMMLGHYANGRPTPPPNSLHYERWLFADGRGEDKIKLWETHLAPDIGAPQTWNSAMPAAWHHSTWVGNQTVRYLEQHKDEPFVLWASFPDPHTPFDCPEPWSRLHHPDDVELPYHMERDLDRRPWWHEKSLQGKPDMPDAELSAHRAKWSRVTPPNEEKLRHTIANYYGMISLIDHNVGRILTALDELGLSENTIVVFTSDHGEWLGDHGLLLKGPMLYEGLLRVGCVVRGPGVGVDKVIDDPVSTLDLASTFYDYAGVSEPQNLHSKSLKPLLESGSETRDFARNEWDLRPSRSGVNLKLRTARTKTAKLTLEEISAAGEMYDLNNDPHEMDNLFGDPGYSKLQKELTDMIQSRPDDMVPQKKQVGMA